MLPQLHAQCGVFLRFSLHSAPIHLSSSQKKKKKKREGEKGWRKEQGGKEEGGKAARKEGKGEEEKGRQAGRMEAGRKAGRKGRVPRKICKPLSFICILSSSVIEQTGCFSQPDGSSCECYILAVRSDWLLSGERRVFSY